MIVERDVLVAEAVNKYTSVKCFGNCTFKRTHKLNLHLNDYNTPGCLCKMVCMSFNLFCVFIDA